MSFETLENGVTITPLRQIPHQQGAIFHGLKASEGQSFVGFGEAYFSTVHFNEIKGWKRHRQMTMNVIAPTGLAEFHIHSEPLGKTSQILVGTKHYCRLTIPPGLWVAFKGLDTGLNLILNVASMEHDPSEADNLPIDQFPLAHACASKRD